jgi:hypothetical protein
MFASWTLSRMLVLFAALGFALIGTQVSLFHYRGNFRHWTMYIPVTGAPLAALALGWLAFYPSLTAKTVVIWILWIEVFAGLGGFTMHARGIRQRLGGFVMNNVLTGPPIVLPLTLTAFSLLGLMALYWRL